MWYEIKGAASDGPATIRIFGEIGFEVTLSAFLEELDALGPRDLIVEINSRGGDVFDGLAIYSRLRRHEGHVTTRVEVIAASMATVIAMAGDVKQMLDGSMWMVHKPSTFAAGNEDDFDTVQRALTAVKTSMIAAYVDGSGRTAEEVNALLDEAPETWMTSAEAKAFGFIDEVITSDLDVAASLRYVDFSRFENPPTFEGVTTTTTGTEPSFETVKTGEQSPNTHAATTAQSKGSTMTPEEKAELESTARAAGVRAESERRQKITALVGDFKDQLGDSYQALLDDCLGNYEIDESHTTQRILAALKAQPAPSATQTVEVVEDQRDKFRTGALSAIMHRAGFSRDNTANEFRGWSSMDIAKQCLTLSGVNYSGMDKLQIAGAAFSHSSSDFPLLLQDAAEKMLMGSYTEFADTWSSWCQRGSVSDFKVNNLYRMGTFANLEVVQPGGEYKEGSVNEERETIQAETKGKMISFDRQMLINDDMGAFGRIASMMGRAAARTVEADVYALLESNPNMSDGTAAFHADHGNLPTGSALDTANMSLAKTLMRKQSFAGESAVLDIRPVNLLVPVELEDTALVLMRSSTQPDGGNANSRKPNIHANSLTVIATPYITDTNAWYLTAGANDVPTIEVAFLDGNDTPFLDSQDGFTIDGVRWKVRLDYGMAFVDHRGAVFNSGA